MTKKKSLKGHDAGKKDSSPFVPQREKFGHDFKIRQRDDLTERQKEFLKLALDKDTKVIFLTGPAGTSKTFLSVLTVLEMIQSHRISDMVYVRSVVESSDQKMGFLPGDMNEKVAPYMVPLLDKLDEFLDKGTIDKLLKEERITSKPIGFLRGLNWNAKGIIADEAQNLTSKELITLMTRIGEFSKLFICGDSMQSDINGKSGFVDITKMFDSTAAREQGIHVFEFTEVDIVRSALVRFIVKTVNENSRYLPHK